MDILSRVYKDIRVLKKTFERLYGIIDGEWRMVFVQYREGVM